MKLQIVDFRLQIRPDTAIRNRNLKSEI